jgi:hypothetical protein
MYVYVISGWEGHWWSSPSVAHLGQLMRHVSLAESSAELAAKGQRARQDMLHRYSLRVMRGHVATEVDRVFRSMEALYEGIQGQLESALGGGRSGGRAPTEGSSHHNADSEGFADDHTEL